MLAFFSISTLQAQSNDKLWLSLESQNLKFTEKHYIKADQASYFKINPDQLLANFMNCPEEKPMKLSLYGKEIAFPNAQGKMRRFAFCQYYMMEPGLRAKWDFVKTFYGQGLDDPREICFVDFTTYGFRAIVRSPEGDYFVDPVNFGATDLVQVYSKSDYMASNPRKQFSCHQDVTGMEEVLNRGVAPGSGNSVNVSGTIRKEYRLAVGVTAEYTAFHGGVNNAASAITTSVNRVNSVYIGEVCIRMNLVANNNLLISTNAATDGYTNTDVFAMLGENQTKLNSVIGAANYDIGHVFSTDPGGGVASKGSVCTTGKARGATGSDSPVGDTYDIDYVAHEMGHQFGCDHTFNSVSGSCGGGNRSATSAFEPGSGTTIMAYAGICPPDNTQNNSDAYFVFRSHEQIMTFITTGAGNSCGTSNQTGNTPPSIPAIQSGLVLPLSTPFKLTSTLATDAQGDSLTYCWEENDLGNGGAPNAPTGDAPIFRSFSPVKSRERLFPRLSTVLSNVAVLGERLPTYARNLKFKVTVRDNRANGGGVNSTTANYTVAANTGPFSITAPNVSNLNYEAGTPLTITWNVANTHVAPVSSPKVRILLSVDNGTTFPFVLADSTNNDGSFTTNLPLVESTNCRVMIEAYSNIFFDINNARFRISPPTTAVITYAAKDSVFCPGDTFDVKYKPTGTTYNAGNQFKLQLSNATGQFTTPVEIGTITATDSGTFKAKLPANLAGGTGYKLRVVSTNPVRSGSASSSTLEIKSLPANPSAIGGLTTICPNDTVSFQVSPIANVVDYNWTIPSGASFIGSPNSNSVRVLFANTAGTVTVNGTNSCGAGPVRTATIAFKQILPALATINSTSPNNTACQGTDMVFNLTATNGGVTPVYKWLRNNQVIPNVSGLSYTSNALVNGDKISAVLVSSLSCGTPNVDTSNVITVNITTRRTVSVNISANIQNDTTCVGNPTTFTAQAVNPGANPTYQWSRNNVVIPNATTNSVLINNLADKDSVRARITSNASCLVSPEAFSSWKKVRVFPVSVNAGLDTNLCRGYSPISFVGIPAGGLWSGTGIQASGLFPVLAPGIYNVIYSVQKYGCNVTDPKVIRVNAVDTVIYQNANDVLSVNINGATGFQWIKDGNAIPGANAANLTITESGNYCVSLTLPNGCKAQSACIFQTVVSLAKLSGNGWKLMPNPAQEVFTLQNDNGETALIEVFNAQGKSIYAAKALAETTVVSVQNWSAGMYVVKIKTLRGESKMLTLIKN